MSVGVCDSWHKISRYGDFLCRICQRRESDDRPVASRSIEHTDSQSLPGLSESGSQAVDKQVYALWNVLQKRKFRYSSVSNTSLSSNVVYSQRVRTFDDALESSQINCVDGSVLFASLLRAINIEPILVRTPGHMFVDTTPTIHIRI